MNLIFMGTPDFAVGTLEALIDAGHDVKNRAVSTGKRMCSGSRHRSVSAEKNPGAGMCGISETV